MQALHLAPRWSERGVHPLGVIERDTVTLAPQKTTSERSYSISNPGLSRDPQAQALEVTRALREYCHVESDNWIRDGTLEDDHVKPNSPKQAQLMGSLRSLAMRVLRRFNVPNF